jgi:VCBS repeat-containing protein
VYGTFEAGPSNSWTYRLDNERAATNALQEGQQAFETFMMTAADQFGAFVTQPVTIMVVGSYDQPIF